MGHSETQSKKTSAKPAVVEAVADSLRLAELNRRRREAYSPKGKQPREK